MLLAGCGGTTSPQIGTLHGVVTRGPIMPVCREGVPCSEPAHGTRILFKQADSVSGSVTVAKDGSYSVSLPAGVYTVAVAQSSPIGSGISPSSVTISQSDRKVDFQIDTGIR